jgi:hypothetical protein
MIVTSEAFMIRENEKVQKIVNEAIKRWSVMLTKMLKLKFKN